MQNSSSDFSSYMKRKRFRSWWMRRVQYLYYRLVRLKGSPPAIARGIAVGVFAGFFPLFGLQTLIGILLATFCQGNKLAAAAATWVSNPLTYVPIYTFNYGVGRWLLGGDPIDLSNITNLSLEELLELGGGVAGRLFFGCLVVGLIAAIVSYGVSVRFIRRLHLSRRPPKKWYPD